MLEKLRLYKSFWNNAHTSDMVKMVLQAYKGAKGLMWKKDPLNFQDAIL